jgi:AraC-like DNA-binding protein
MLGITIAVFRESSDFQDALRASGCTDLLVVAGGEFRARLTRVALQYVMLDHAEENVDRLASITVPPGLVRVLLPPHRGRLVCSGMLVDAGCLVTQAPGESRLERLVSPCHWRDIILPVRQLVRYGRAVIGRPIAIPADVGLWHPPVVALRELIRLHAAVMRVAETHPGKTMGRETARGLEQELIAGLIECLSDEAVAADTAVRHADIMTRFEKAIAASPERIPSMADVCAALNVPERTLRQCCHEQLGMSPRRYQWFRHMQEARAALRSAEPGAATVAGLARQHGFTEAGRFAASYKTLFGELPSATLRRSLDA